MRTIKLGKTIKSTGMPASVSNKAHVSYPSFSVEGIELPLGSSHVGKTISATVELKVLKAGPEIDEYGDKQKKHRARFEVHSITLPSLGLKDLKEIDPELSAGGDSYKLDKAEEAEFHSSKLGSML